MKKYRSEPAKEKIKFNMKSQPDIRDGLDNRKNEEQLFKGDDISHNVKGQHHHPKKTNKNKLNYMNKAKRNPRPNRNSDLKDSPDDQEKLKNDEATIYLPDVEDIPGQEHVHPPNPGEYADTTISSADEEGDNVWTDKGITEESSTVTDMEKKLLDDSANDMPTRDDQSLRRASLDSTDNEGTPLNEKTSFNAVSGSDLDVPGSEDDDTDEAIGEEDEENNPYSLGGDDNSINEERSGV